MELQQAIKIVRAEVERAEVKFPTWPTDPLHALAVLGEEFGELTKAVLQVSYEPGKSTLNDVREEAVQTAAMALRFVASLDRYAYAPGHQHSQAKPVEAAAARTNTVSGGQQEHSEIMREITHG